jgi:hypothetical protein
MTTIKYGSMPDTNALKAQLKQNTSNKADVLKALGAPRGYGMARLSSVHDPSVIWFYEFTETDGRDIKLKMLLVFFEGDKYGGHLWFSSLTKAEKFQ